MENCIFCKIINKEMPAEVLQETDEAVIFKDIRPSAPVHYLIVSKRHIASVKEISNNDEALIGHLIFLGKEAAEKLGLQGYKLTFNIGREGGQIVDHIHLHLLGGWSKGEKRTNA